MIACKQCGKDLGFFAEYGYRVFDVGMERVGLFCKEHSNELEKKLKNKRFIEEYKETSIYMKDGKYFPYWDCLYYFDNLDDVKIRIDNSQMAIVNLGVFKLINV